MSDPRFERIRGQFSAEKSEIGNIRSRVQQALSDTQNVLGRMQATESELSYMQDSTLSDEKSNLKSNIYRMQSAKSYLQQALSQIENVDLPDYVE
jgi:predicted  nucleic acid-binding Zn-ribbon protein